MKYTKSGDQRKQFCCYYNKSLNYVCPYPYVVALALTRSYSSDDRLNILKNISFYYQPDHIRSIHEQSSGRREAPNKTKLKALQFKLKTIQFVKKIVVELHSIMASATKHYKTRKTFLLKKEIIRKMRILNQFLDVHAPSIKQKERGDESKIQTCVESPGCSSNKPNSSIESDRMNLIAPRKLPPATDIPKYLVHQGQIFKFHSYKRKVT